MAKPNKTEKPEEAEELEPEAPEIPATMPPEVAAIVTGDGAAIPNPVVIQAPTFDAVRRVAGHIGELRAIADTTVSANVLGPYRDRDAPTLSRSEIESFVKRVVFMGGDPLAPRSFNPKFVQAVQCHQRGWVLITTEGIHFGIKDPAEFTSTTVNKAA